MGKQLGNLNLGVLDRTTMKKNKILCIQLIIILTNLILFGISSMIWGRDIGGFILVIIVLLEFVIGGNLIMKLK